KGAAGAAVDEHLETLADVDKKLFEFDGAREQAAVRPNDVQRAAVRGRGCVAAGVRAVEYPWPDPAARWAGLRVTRRVHEHGVTDVAIRHGYVIHAVKKLPVRCETAVLNDQRNVVDTPPGRQRQTARYLIIDDQQAGQAPDNFLGGRWIGMRMKPERRGRLINRQLGLPLLSRRDDLMRSAVGCPRDDQPMPMHGDGLGDIVADLCYHLLATPHPYRRPEIGS